MFKTFIFFTFLSKFPTCTFNFGDRTGPVFSTWRGMAVDDNRKDLTRYKPNVDGKVVNNHYGGFMRGFSLKIFLEYRI